MKTIEELQAEKQDLENKINALINDFVKNNENVELKIKFNKGIDTRIGCGVYKKYNIILSLKI